MSTLIEYTSSGVWLVIFIFIAGVVSSTLLAPEPIEVRRISGDILRSVIVAIIIMAWGVVGHHSIFCVIIVSCFSAIAWPQVINAFVQLARRSINRIFFNDR